MLSHLLGKLFNVHTHTRHLMSLFLPKSVDSHDVNHIESLSTKISNPTYMFFTTVHIDLSIYIDFTNLVTHKCLKTVKMNDERCSI